MRFIIISYGWNRYTNQRSANGQTNSRYRYERTIEISMYSRTSSFLASLSERTHRNRLAFSFLFLVWTTSRVLDIQRDRYSDHRELFSRFLHLHLTEAIFRILSRRLLRSIACNYSPCVKVSNHKSISAFDSCRLLCRRNLRCYTSATHLQRY